MTISAEFSIDLDPILEARIDPEAIAYWIEDRLNDGRNHFIQSVSRGGGGGRTYRRGGKTHKASAPGEYPTTDGGRLVAIGPPQMNNDFEGQLQTEVEYAEYLTRGTPKMGQRKMLGDALEEVIKARPETDLLAAAAIIEVSTA